MASSVKDSFVDLERHRQLLEENTEQLTRLLQQWRFWDAEYEALKEEVESSSPRDLARIRRDFDGQFVTNKEVSDIFGKPDIKPAHQIVSQLDRRLDYVQRNIETLEKRVREAEDKASAVAIVSAPDVRNEDGLPITDIVEELDDHDNVVSYRLQVPSDAQPQARAALEKAGVNLLPEPQDPDPTEPEVQARLADSGAPPRPLVSTSRPPAGKKGVSFADDTKPPADNSAQSKAQTRLMEIMRSAREQEAMASRPAVIPEGDSPEDAALRRDMLAYSMSEIAPVVAELELEEGFSDVDEDDEEMGDYDYFYEEDEDEDEYGDQDDKDEEWGESTRSYLSPEYRQRMLELERKLGVSALSGKDKQALARGEAETGEQPRVGRVTIAVDPDPSPRSVVEALPDGKHEAKSRVRFAESLDIAVAKPIPEVKARKGTADVLGDIVERSSLLPEKGGSPRAEPISTTITGPERAPRRFLADQEPNIAPSGPEGMTIATSIVERQTAVAAREPSEFDAALLHQEAAVEYHRVRNRLIQKGGGFLNEDTSAVVPLDESEGGPKRMSRFKAARLSRH